MMKLIKRSEMFQFPSPIGEPDVHWIPSDPYYISRIVTEDGTIIWFGLKTNWMKKPEQGWTVLGINHEAKPLPHYLPDIVYGEDRTSFIECDPPIYEVEYLKLKNDDKF